MPEYVAIVIVSHSPLVAVQVVLGWVADKGPCFADIDHAGAYARVRRLAAAQGFEEVPGADQVLLHWGAAHARWRKRVKRVADRMA